MTLRGTAKTEEKPRYGTSIIDPIPVRKRSTPQSKKRLFPCVSEVRVKPSRLGRVPDSIKTITEFRREREEKPVVLIDLNL